MARLGFRMVTAMATTSNQPAPFENVSLFATCVLPGCRNDVAEWGDVCAECIAAAGDYLRPTTGPKLTEDEIHDRDLATREDLRAQRRIGAVEPSDQPERKQNQMCWLCEQRRTCTRTPQGWECDACVGVS